MFSPALPIPRVRWRWSFSPSGIIELISVEIALRLLSKSKLETMISPGNALIPWGYRCLMGVPLQKLIFLASANTNLYGVALGK